MSKIVTSLARNFLDELTQHIEFVSSRIVDQEIQLESNKKQLIELNTKQKELEDYLLNNSQEKINE